VKDKKNSSQQLKSSQQKILTNIIELKCESKIEIKNLNLNLDAKPKIYNFVENHKPSEENSNKKKTLVFGKILKNSKKDFNFISNENTNKNSKNIIFGISFFLKSLICEPKDIIQKRKLKAYKDLVCFLDQRMYLIHYLKMLYSINITNSLLFNSTQKKIIDKPAKPNIFRIDDLKLYGLYNLQEENSDNKEILEYYNSKLTEKNLDKYDKTLVQFLPENIKNSIDRDL
jgi:hypothetical protein